MNFKRIGRILVCLLLICCLTFHVMIPKAEASSIGAAATIVKASTVTCNPYIIAGATLIALGVYAGVETGAFETVANNCVDALEAAGTWIKDGAMELLRTEDVDGNACYYVDSGLMEDVRSWAYSSETVVSVEVSTSQSFTFEGQSFSVTSDQPFGLIAIWFPGTTSSSCGYVFAFAERGLASTVMVNGSAKTVWATSSHYNYYNLYGFSGSLFYSRPPETSARLVRVSSYDKAVYKHELDEILSNSIYSSLDISIGTVPTLSSNLTDGSSARAWSEPYTDRGLKVYGGGSGNNNNDGKWFWPVVLVAGADLLAMSQADAWAGETPQEFDDYDTKEELKVMDTPEVEFGFGIVLEPDSGDTEDPTQSTEPTTPGGLPDIGGGDNPDTGGDTDGDTGSDTGNEFGNQTDYTSWFEQIIKGIEELPSKFESWITDCKTAIEDLPSKFADWFNSIIEKLSSIWETLKSIPQTILDGLRNILTELFVPQEDYLTDKLTSLRERFSFVDSIIDTGKAIGNALVTGSAEPPVIYIHLEDTEGKYNIGGTTPFLDMRWYARYKPVGDQLLSSLIWIFFVWRCFVHAPNIISGIAGDVENLNMPDGGGMYLSGSHSPFDGGPYEKPKRGRFERRPKRRR